MTTPTSARGRLAGLISTGQPPEVIEQARAELREAKVAACIRELVNAAPPLDDAARERLAALLRAPDTDLGALRAEYARRHAAVREALYGPDSATGAAGAS
jgi:hypothetical protein